MSIPRTTHPWLRPLYDVLEGRGTRQPQIGSPTGTVGLYGATGIAGRIATGTAGITSWTGAAGASVGLLWFNGGSGAFYTVGDLVVSLKNIGVLKP